uniref:Uncharacterized protein n=1 Tax=Triticum urartu TaxID=4572 RepID=A0A8R7UZP2_TRIUA
MAVESWNRDRGCCNDDSSELELVTTRTRTVTSGCYNDDYGELEPCHEMLRRWPTRPPMLQPARIDNMIFCVGDHWCY